MNAAEFLVSKGILQSVDLSTNWNLNITRDCYVGTSRKIVEVLDEYAKAKVIEALRRGQGYYTDVEYVHGESSDEIVKSMFKEHGVK
jgi:hypothetical protein